MNGANVLLAISLTLFVVWVLFYLLNPFKWTFIMEMKGKSISRREVDSSQSTNDQQPQPQTTEAASGQGVSSEYAQAWLLTRVVDSIHVRKP